MSTQMDPTMQSRALQQMRTTVEEYRVMSRVMQRVGCFLIPLSTRLLVLIRWKARALRLWELQSFSIVRWLIGLIRLQALRLWELESHS
jgi:hypothetical protein